MNYVYLHQYSGNAHTSKFWSTSFLEKYCIIIVKGEMVAGNTSIFLEDNWVNMYSEPIYFDLGIHLLWTVAKENSVQKHTWLQRHGQTFKSNFIMCSYMLMVLCDNLGKSEDII